MPELSGFGVIAALDGARVPAVVFITAFERYALQAFEVGAVDYLQKPVTQQRFAAAVARAKERLDRRSAGVLAGAGGGARSAERARGFRTRFVVRRGNTHHIVPADQVDWMDVADNYLCLHVGPKTHLWRGTMKQAEEELDPDAVRADSSLGHRGDRPDPDGAEPRVGRPRGRAQGRRAAAQQSAIRGSGASAVEVDSCHPERSEGSRRCHLRRDPSLRSG